MRQPVDLPVLEVDNATKQMDVFVDGALACTLPVSLGKPSTPSSSGHMVIMDKQEHTIFDTTRTATNLDDRYRIPIDYAQRQYTDTWTWLVCALEGSPPPL
jgi:lipoprotein-anchoring transpeptidase ErfK/SrfK